VSWQISGNTFASFRRIFYGFILKAAAFQMMEQAILALQDGSVYRGKAFGARATMTGEVCFNTSMTGYQEILTDPSYKAQIVTMTYPLIGNYGVNDQDVESYKPHVHGFVVREVSRIYSNWRADRSLPEYLVENGIPGISGVDTRAITRKLRVNGAMNGVISTEDISDEEAVRLAQSWEGLIGTDYVREVTHPQPFDWDPGDALSGEFRLPFGIELGDPRQMRHPLRAADIPIVAMDYGIKYNILRMLRQSGFKVTVLPASSSLQDIQKHHPAGLFLSNGPGDPAALGYAVRTIREAVDFGYPIFGICLGHQILAQALGATTFKLKFGHRGANQPVKDLETGRVEITSQNHGFAVNPDSLSGIADVHKLNLNDRTVEGIRHKSKPAYSVQYHPEASPGPHDSAPLFGEFRSMIESRP
jgi:carbamoyl-phosphate synthase small subunit